MPMVETQPTLQAGGTLNPYEHLYVSREDVEHRLYSLLHRGEYCNVLSSRQVGKSSTVVKVGLRLEQEGARVVMIDLAGELGSPESAEQWYTGFLGRIAGDLGLGVNVAKWWDTVATGTANQRFLQFFRELAVGTAGAPLVILVDEIDSTLKVKYTDDFFTAIRSMYNSRGSIPSYRHTTFCLVGVASPNELIKDPRTTAYNVGTSVEIRDFDRERDDLDALYQAVSPDPAVGKALVDAVFEWTDGHPYLTVRLCRDIVEQHISTPAEVDALLRSRFRSYAKVESDVHFQQISRFLGTRVAERVETLRLYRRILSGKKERDEATARHIYLKLAGIVKRDPQGFLTVRNRVYRSVFNLGWVRGHLPVEWREQLLRVRRIGIVLVVISIPALGVGLYASTVQRSQLSTQRDQLAAQTTQLEARQDSLKLQANLLQRSRDDLSLALARATHAGREARIAMGEAVAAKQQADSLRRLAEANLTAAAKSQALAVSEAYEADSLRLLEAKRREQMQDTLLALRELRKRDLALVRGDTLSWTVSVFEQSGRADSAMVAAHRMLQSYRDARNEPKVAFAHERIGGLHAQLGRFDTAMVSLRSALEIRLREQPGSVALAETHEAIGEVARKWSQYTLALTQYEAAESILRIRGTPVDRMRVSLKLARTRQGLRQYPASAATFDSALAVLQRSLAAGGVDTTEWRAQRARILREQAVVLHSMGEGRRFRQVLREADDLESNGRVRWTFVGSGGVGYQTEHGLGIGISESVLYTRMPFRPGVSVRGFWSFQDSSWIVSGGPTASYAPFRGIPLETAVDLHLGTTGSGQVRTIPGFAATFSVNSWTAVARAYWPAFDHRVRFETSVGVNLGFSPRDLRGIRPENAPARAPTSRSDSAAYRRTVSQR
jgi:tetratricopeptide (TPR) repeat protein